MQVLISDANILIDMFEGEILELMFQLPYEFAVSDMLYRDELTLYHERLFALGLQQRELTSASMQEALRLVEAYTNPSRYDCFSLALAKRTVSVVNRRYGATQSGGRRKYRSPRNALVG